MGVLVKIPTKYKQIQSYQLIPEPNALYRKVHENN